MATGGDIRGSRAAEDGNGEGLPRRQPRAGFATSRRRGKKEGDFAGKFFRGRDQRQRIKEYGDKSHLQQDCKGDAREPVARPVHGNRPERDS